jgi:hypothetical protein
LVEKLGKQMYGDNFDPLVDFTQDTNSGPERTKRSIDRLHKAVHTAAGYVHTAATTNIKDVTEAVWEGAEHLKSHLE